MKIQHADVLYFTNSFYVMSPFRGFKGLKIFIGHKNYNGISLTEITQLNLSIVIYNEHSAIKSNKAKM